ncbi:MAG: chemotaxis response regulator protein-glutamate methylesterase [Planctomycetota bacterium]
MAIFKSNQPAAVKKIRTLIVDDSSFVRNILRSALANHPQIEVVGFAVDGLDALQKIRVLRPDVITLDVEMPRLNGIGVLERVVGKAPVSFVMVSSLTQAGAMITFEALRKGAFDYVTKPSSGSVGNLPAFRQQLLEKIISAAQAKSYRRHPCTAPKSSNSSAAPTSPPNRERGWVVAIGISCGGPQTLMAMMPAFPSDFVPILITQHMPAEFTAAFAKHLDNVCNMNVREARHGELLSQGTVLVAPGNQHMKLVRQGGQLRIQLDGGEKVSGHRPSADVMFDSVSRACGRRAIGVIMTGMGHDGADAITRMRQAGAWTIAQDQETSLVYGMPHEAVKKDGADHVLPLSKIPIAISRLLQRGPKPSPVTA